MINAVVIRETGLDAKGRPTRSAALEQVEEDFLGEGDVTVEVHFSSLNYKDGLALTGRPGVVRTTPLIGGIDVAGTVRDSTNPRWSPGDPIVLNGAGMSETRHGGLTTVAKIDGALAVSPGSFSLAEAAAIGTAGYTAALCALKLTGAGVTPEDGPVLVTGATGGVGTVAIMILATLGFEVHASTGRIEQHGELLTDLGASHLIARAELSEPGRPLQKATWAGVVDSVGGTVLANAIAQTKPGGVVAACGLAGSADLPATVMPFILRGVTLAGADSVWAPLESRQQAWRILGETVNLTQLESLTTTVPLAESISAAEALLAGRSHGRALVAVR